MRSALVASGTVNPFVGIAHMLDHPFLRSAFIAGTGLALAAGLVGHMLVLRGQVFSADALSHVAFTGALAALAFGIDLRVGLYGACVVFAVLMAALGRRATADDTVIGSVFAWVLGIGALFLSVFTTSQSGTGTGGDAGVNVLFGSILGLTNSQTLVDAIVTVVVAALVVVIGRPLLFASLDPEVASARGMPVRLLGYRGGVDVDRVVDRLSRPSDPAFLRHPRGGDRLLPAGICFHPGPPTSRSRAGRPSGPWRARCGLSLGWDPEVTAA
jgi:hypothetical protein